MTYLGNHTNAVQRGLNLGVGLFIVSEALFFLVYTILLAVLFTALQGIEYTVSSFTISDGIYGSCFYFGTGLTQAPILL
jgi:cytochrome c oxidase subunit 3